MKNNKEKRDYIMVIKKTIFFYFLTFFLFTNCKSSSSIYNIKEDVYDVKVIIRGPSSCCHIIFYNRNGKGKIIRGRTLDLPAKNFNSFYNLEYLSFFEVNSLNKIKNINSTINSITKSELTKTNYILDARRKEVYVDGFKKFDIYGWKGEMLIKFLNDLSSYLPYDINSFCTTDPGLTLKEVKKVD